VDEQGTLLAGTRGGLYVRHPSDPSGAWRRLPLGGGPPEALQKRLGGGPPPGRETLERRNAPEREPGARRGPSEDETVVDILRVGNEVLILTRSNVFAARLDAPSGVPTPASERFRHVALSRTDENGREESLFRLIFEMHPGRTWGLPGRLLVDAAGVLLVFFTVTGAWFWWRKRRRTLAQGTGGRLARSGLALHLRLGLWAAPLLLFVTLTGFFQRPPFLIAIANATYRIEHYPGVRSANPWHDKLRKAVFDPARGVVVFSTADGFYETPAEALPKNEATLAPVPGMTPPVSVMGATAFRCQSDGSYLIGSMSGLYLWDRVTDNVRDLFTGLEPAEPTGPPVGEHRVVGLLSTGKGWLWADYDRGLLTPEGEPAGLPMPPELADGGRISLWHALFEVHNGRAFGVLLGWWSWIVVPLGGLILLTVTFTGVYDYLLPKWRKRRVAEEEKEG
jgi:hypothetical protein